MKKAWKKTLAGLLALTLVAGFTPVNVGGFLTKSTGIVAKAAIEIPDDKMQVFGSDFSNFGNEGWTRDRCHDNSKYYIQDSNACFGFYNSTNPPQYLITPEIENFEQELTVRFRYMAGNKNYPESFSIGWSSTDKSSESFTWSETTTTTDKNIWHDYEKNVPAGTKYVAIRYESYDKYFLSIDDFYIITDRYHAPYNVTLSGGTNASSTGGNVTQQGVTQSIDKVTFTANEGYYFPPFEEGDTIKQDGIVIKRIDRNTIEVSGRPTANTALIVPNAEEIPTLTLTGGANATASGSILSNDMIYTAESGYCFASFAPIELNGITVKRISPETISVSGSPEVDTEISIPDAVIIPRNYYQFDKEQDFSDWTFIDADGDGYTWSDAISSRTYSNIVIANHSGDEKDGSSLGTFSYSNKFGAYNADNWAVSPSGVVTGDGLFSIWGWNQSNYSNDSFTVYVAPKNTCIFDKNISNWTAVSNTITPPSRNWTMYTVDLSDYIGQEIYIMLRHKDYDKFAMYVDDIFLPFDESTISTKHIIKPTVSINNWEYELTASTPSVSGNYGNGEVTYKYKVKDADDSTYTDKVPTEIGEYTIKAEIAETEHTYGASATADFKILTPENYVSTDSVPEREGMIFSGFFTSRAYNKAFIGSGKAYVKYVDASKYLKASISGTELAQGQTKTNLVFNTLVDSNKYRNVTFVINIGGKVKKVQVNSLVKDGADYKASYTFNGVTKAMLKRGVTVTPYWTTLDGTVVQGTSASYGTVPVNQSSNPL